MTKPTAKSEASKLLFDHKRAAQSVFLTKFVLSGAMAEQRELPGWPTKRLVKQVRSHLWHYGIRPKPPMWRSAWVWAHAIARSYSWMQWPLPSEIATQYALLLLAEMKENHSLKLPYRASKVVPDEVRSLLTDNPIPSIEDHTTKSKAAGEG